MHDCRFELIVEGLDEDHYTDELANAIYEAGLDDSTPGVTCGVVTIAMARDASSMREAITSAIRQAESADPRLRVARVDLWDDEVYADEDIRTTRAINAALVLRSYTDEDRCALLRELGA